MNDREIERIRKIVKVVFTAVFICIVLLFAISAFAPKSEISLLDEKGIQLSMLIGTLTTLISMVTGLVFFGIVVYTIIKIAKSKDTNGLGIRVRRPEMMEEDDTIFKDAAYKDENGHIRLNFKVLDTKEDNDNKPMQGSYIEPEKQQEEYLKNDYLDNDYSYYNDDSRYDNDFRYNLNGEVTKKDKKRDK